MSMISYINRKLFNKREYNRSREETNLSSVNIFRMEENKVIKCKHHKNFLCCYLISPTRLPKRGVFREWLFPEGQSAKRWLILFNIALHLRGYWVAFLMLTPTRWEMHCRLDVIWERKLSWSGILDPSPSFYKLVDKYHPSFPQVMNLFFKSFFLLHLWSFPTSIILRVQTGCYM